MYNIRIGGCTDLLLHSLAQSPVDVLGEEIVEPAGTQTQVSYKVETEQNQSMSLRRCCDQYEVSRKTKTRPLCLM